MPGYGQVNSRDPMASIPREARGRIHRTRQPAWIAPMLATLVAEPFSSEDWIYEPKLDGVRCLVFRDPSHLRLLSRNEKSLNGTYPEVTEPLARQPLESYIADGEVVAFSGGVTSFARLQRRMGIQDPDEARSRGVEIFYYLFDLLYLNGHDLRQVPLIERKELLRRTFVFRDPLRFTEHRKGGGETYFREACRKGLEGIIAKRAASAWVSGRSRDWQKFKCSAEQEFLIIGYTDPRGKRVGLGALLLGYYERGRLVYAGKVGTGFGTSLLTSLARELSPLEIPKPAFEGEAERGAAAHWVKPKLLAQVAFTEWTRDGKLRHPRFLGIRRDKNPRDVVRERA